MVRSSSSCFKILTCASDSVDKDDLELPPESKGSMDKHGWSFRRRSARHRVLSNTVISETLSTQNKESPESTRVDFHTQSNPTPDKISISQPVDETSSLSVAINTKEPDSITTESRSKNDHLVSTESNDKVDCLTTVEDTSEINQNLEESVIIVVQAAIRGHLARRLLFKIKGVVKLQAVVRGHLVRRQAIGTLRCVQAIVKMQALVRARRDRMLLQGSISDEKVDGKPEESNQHIKPLGKENLGTKANTTYSSTEKWLSNRFARQLLESTPKRKQIHIKCDPSKQDSSWKWLERWMSISSSDPVQPEKQLSDEYQEPGQSDTNSELGSHIPAEVLSDSANSKPGVTNMAIPPEDEENLITYDSGNFDFHACQPRSLESKDDIQHPQHDDAANLIISKETSSTVDVSQTESPSDATSLSLHSVIPSKPKPEADVEQSNHSMKRAASEQPETAVKKFAFGSRKACNPAFAAVQSKFEELSSSATSSRSINSTGQVLGVESKLDNISSPADSVARTKELSHSGGLISPEPRVHVGGSECGTELSISSTLDSLDGSEDGVEDTKHEVVTEKVDSLPIEATDYVSNAVNVEVESNNGASKSELSLSLPAAQVKLEDVKGDSEAVVVVDSPQVEQQMGRSTSEVQSQVDSLLDKSSPEGSPRSHITASESHGTPSSHISTRAKRSKSDKKHSQNKKSHSAGKQSPSNPNHDSGARSSTEQLLKDSKNGKRRNSFGSSKADHVEQEPRDSSSTSLPSYMQATESARAKAHANISPRSSPDVLDKEFYIKKRHSLPSANGKQGSPRMQRSMSQAQPGAKGNGTATHDRKWQR